MSLAWTLGWTVLAGCADDGADDSGADRAEPEPYPWTDPLEPDSLHLLVGSTPGEGNAGNALDELGADLSDRWAIALDEGAGTAGAIRHPDGSTTYAYTRGPPDFESAIHTVDASGTLTSSLDEVFGAISFVHGLVETPAGDWIVVDTIASQVRAIDNEGQDLWWISWSGDNGGVWPNGVAIHQTDEGVVQIGVTLLYHDGENTTDRVEVWELGERTTPPSRVWTWPAEGEDATGYWPHGPHFLDDGTLSVALAARGQVMGLDGGEETWRIPPEPGALAFPRDALFLPDGSLVIADAAAELLRVADPFGDFAIVDSRRTPGVYCVESLDCATKACLP